MPQYMHYAQCDFKHVNCLQKFRGIIASLKSISDDNFIITNETLGEGCNCLPECFATVYSCGTFFFFQ